MITLTILNLKTRKTTIETYLSKDKAEKRLQTLKTAPIQKTEKKGEWLDGWSYDQDSEKALIETYVDVSRRITGKDS